MHYVAITIMSCAKRDSMEQKITLLCFMFYKECILDVEAALTDILVFSKNHFIERFSCWDHRVHMFIFFADSV